ncbi:MAG: ABC transporter permease [Actinomycetota bacterium]
MTPRPVAIRQIGAIARRDALVQLSYQLNLLLYLGTAVFGAFIAYFVAELVGDSELLEPYRGTYFDFVIVGLAITSYASLAVAAFNEQIRQEQSIGTLEVLLAGPARLSTLLSGGFVVPLILTTLEVALLLGIGIGVFGAGIGFSNLLLAVPVVVLTVLNFCALGIASAALIMLAKRGDPISGPLYQATLLLSGAIFPIEVFPGWLQAVSKATPGYYGVRGARDALLTDGGFAAIRSDLVVLALFAAVMLPVAVWIFARALSAAKRLGVLASY